MAEQASAFCADPAKGLRWEGGEGGGKGSSGRLTLSRIFYWFADDWGGPGAAARAAAAAIDRAAAPTAAGVRAHVGSGKGVAGHVEYYPYCWALNRAPISSGL